MVEYEDEELKVKQREESAHIRERIRERNIKVIGTQTNLAVMKKKILHIENRQMQVRDMDQELEEILKEGVAYIENLVGDDPNFTICGMIREQGVMSFFRNIYKDKRELDRSKLRERILEKEKTDIHKRIGRAEKKGKFKEVEDMKLDLYLLEHPEEVKGMLEKHIETLGGQKKSKEYKEIKKKIDELDRDIRIKKDFWGIGEEYEGINYDLREYLGKAFYRVKKSQNVLRYLDNFYGDIMMDYEHLHLVEKYMERHKIEGKEKVEAAKCYKMLEGFYMGTRQMQEATARGMVKPHFDTNADAFDWGRMPHYKKKYMMYLTLPKGYVGYYLEPVALGQTGYRMAKLYEELDYSRIKERFKEARSEITERKRGLFYEWLTLEEESKILSYILCMDFNMTFMEGPYSKDILEDFIIRNRVFPNGRMSNLYDRLVKPYSLDMMGSLLNNKLKPFIEDNKMGHIYYITPERIGVALKEEYAGKEAEVFGKVGGAMKRVEKPTFTNLLKEGYF